MTWLHDLILECVPLGWSGSGSVIRDHSDHGRKNEPMNPLWTRIYRFIYDLGSLILIRIIPKERTLNETTAFCLWDKDKIAMTVRPILLKVSVHKDNVKESKGVGWHHGKKSSAQAAYRVVPPSLETLRSFGKDDENGNVNLKKGIALISKTTTLQMQHAIFAHFLAVTAQLQTEIPSRNVLWRT